jgi:phosphate-selective porin OprO/OprP
VTLLPVVLILLQPVAADRAPADVPLAVPAPQPAPVATATPPPAAPRIDPKPVDPKKDPPKVERFHFRPGEGFELATADGKYALRIRARLQIRYDAEVPHVKGEPSTHLLQIRRARLQFTGNVFGKHNRYYIQLGFAPRDMLGGLVEGSEQIRYNPVRDARLEFTYLRDATVWVGQMKVPFSRQRVISSGNQQFVDRSSVNEEFNLDRDIGLQLRSDDVAGLGKLKYAAGLFLGDGRNAYQLTRTGVLVVGRVSVHPLGEFKDESEADLERMRRPGLSLGGAYAYHDDAPGDRGIHGVRPADGGTTDLHNATADLMFKWRGLSVASAFHVRRARRRNPGDAVDAEGMPVPVAAPRDGLGFFTQVGYLLPPIDLELAARYSFVRGRRGAVTSLVDRDELGGGLSYYFIGHNLKLQLDYFRVWDASLGATPRAAIAAGDDRVRLQLQLAF